MTIDVRTYNRARDQFRRSLQRSPHRAHDLLRSGIRTGFFGGDSALIEDVLIASLATSRNSIRQALQMLAAEGLVDRRPNRGTTVIASLSNVSVDEVVPDFLLWSDGAKVEELDRRLIPATQYIRQVLDLAGREVDMSEVIISVGREPRSLRISYVSPENGPVERVEEVVPVQQAFQQVFGVTLGSCATSISALAAGPSSSRLLGIPQGAPVLVEEVVMYDVGGVPRELSYTHHRADRIALSVHRPLQATSLQPLSD